MCLFHRKRIQSITRAGRPKHNIDNFENLFQEDEEDAPSVLRVWDTEKNTSEDKLFCVHSSKLPVGKPSTFAVKDDLSAAAIGFENGSVVLLTGKETCLL